MSLSEPYDQDNIFAKIIRGEIPSVKVHEDDEVMAFMDAFPQSKGHTLVISKTAQAVNLLDVPADVLSGIMARVQQVAGAVVRALNPDGFRIVQYNGAPAGQSVFHLHFHIIPVWEGVALGQHGDGMADPIVLETLAEQIRREL